MIKLRYCCLIIFLFAFNLKLIGAEIPIYNSTQRISIGKYIDILQTGEEVSFREVLKSSAFKRYNNDVPNIGLINHSVWFKFTVRNFSEINHLLLEIAYPILDQVELFIPIQNGQYKKVIISESSNFNARKYQHPNYIFDLNIPSSTSLTYYLKVKSAEQIILP